MYNKTHGKLSKSIIKPIILEACLRSELAAAGSGELCLDFILNTIPDIIRKQKNKKFSLDNLMRLFVKDLVQDVKKIGRRPSGSSILTHIENLDVPEICKEILQEAYSLSGKSGVIKVKKTNSKDTNLIVRSGSNFCLNVNEIFLKNNGSWTNGLVNCVVIDGIVIDVSEIHHLLESAAESKEPFVIFARDFSPEILQTICYNFQRGTLNVVPVPVPINEDSLNRLVDIAVVCGVDVISSQKGETISASIRRGLKKVEKISINNQAVVIHNKTTTSQKNHHIRRIIESKHDRDISNFSQEVINEKNYLIDKRLDELFSETISLEVGQDLLYTHRLIVEKIDQSLREIKSHTNMGYIFKDDLIKELSEEDFLKKHLKDVLLEQEKELYSIESIILPINFAKSAIKSICSVETVLFYN